MQTGFYSDLFDTVKTATPIKAPSYQEVWWRPADEKQREQAYALAKAHLLMMLLHGDTLVLSNSQIIDSYAWLRFAKEFLTHNLANKVKWPIIQWGYYSDNPPKEKEGLLLRLAMDIFERTSFKLSAWGPVPEETRKKWASSLESMLREGRTTLLLEKPQGSESIDIETIETLKEGFSHTIEYVNEYVKARQARQERSEPDIIYHAPAPHRPRNIWPRLKLCVKKDPKLGQVWLTELERVIERCGYNPERRSDLYDAFFEVVGRNFTTLETFQKYVDRFYNEKVAYSLTQGRGVFTMSDDLPETGFREDAYSDDLADRGNDPEGVVARLGLAYVTTDRATLSSLTPEDVAGVLDTPEFQENVKRLRDYAQEFSLAQDNQTRDELVKKFQEEIDKHQEWLASQLAPKILRRYQFGVKLFVIAVRPVIKDTVDTVISASTHFPKGILSSTITEVLTEALQRVGEAGIKKTVAGRIRKDLHEAIHVTSSLEG